MENRMTVILLHQGRKRPETQSLLSSIPRRVQDGMSIFKLDSDLKARLECSSKVDKIEHFPCFLVTLNGETRVYYSTDTNKVIGLIEEVL